MAVFTGSMNTPTCTTYGGGEGDAYVDFLVETLKPCR